MAEKVLTLEEATALNAELKAKVADQSGTIKDLTEKLNAADKKEAEHLKTIEALEKDVELSGGVVTDLKTKIVTLESQEKEETSKTLHKLGKKKFRLLYSINFKGEEVTDDVLAGNEKLLGEIVATGSGALQEVL